MIGGALVMCKLQMEVSRDIIIKSLRGCANNRICACCGFADCGEEYCSDSLKIAAADLLEKDAATSQASNNCSKWITLDHSHINTDKIESFSWADGRLYVWFRFDTCSSTVWADPDKTKYHRLCKAVGVIPAS